MKTDTQLFVYGAGNIGHNIAEYSQYSTVVCERLNKQALLKKYYTSIEIDSSISPGTKTSARSVQEAQFAASGFNHELAKNMFTVHVWAAGLASVRLCQEFPATSVDQNVSDLIFAARLFISKAEHFNKVGTFVYFSTYAVVGNGTLKNKKPAGRYAEHKLMGEEILKAMFKGAENARLVIIRLPNVIAYSPILSCNRVFDLIKRNKVIILARDGQLPKRAYVDVRDVVKILDTTIKNLESSKSLSTQTINIYPIKNIATVPKLIQMYENCSEFEITVQTGNLPDYEPLTQTIPNTPVNFKYTPLKEAVEFWSKY